MSKEFIAYDTIRNDGFRLARRIYEDGFIPAVLYSSLRGGSYLGNVIHEWFKFAKVKQPILYAAVVAHSYSDTNERVKMVVDGWTYSPDHLRCGDKILLVDDIFDSGTTINSLVPILLAKGIPRRDIKIAVHDYKVFHNKEQQAPIQPDYWCRKHDIVSEEDNNWLHYMSHELMGLSKEDFEKHYFSAYPELRPAFDGLL